mmetsp:Transcript_4605/g.29183  ORF Transcript_4605/g.29183 Transcript_4605/m.29183 type:complete len:162 (-) Transcript_4605:1510-1995(-)
MQQDQDPCYGPHYNARHPAFHEPLEFSSLLENPQPMHPAVVDVDTTNGVLQHLAWLEQSLLANSFFICQTVFQLKNLCVLSAIQGIDFVLSGVVTPRRSFSVGIVLQSIVMLRTIPWLLAASFPTILFRSSSFSRVDHTTLLRVRVPSQVMIRVATFFTSD